MTISEFLNRCDAYAAKRDIGDARLSTLIFNDGKRIGALRAGGDIGVKTLARAVDALAELERQVDESQASHPQGAAAA